MNITQLQKHIKIFMEDNDLKDGDYFNMIYNSGLPFLYNPMQVKKEVGLVSTVMGDANIFFMTVLENKIEKLMSEKEYIKSISIEIAEERLKEAQEQLELALKM
jgi:rRNA processing protein Gar1